MKTLRTTMAVALLALALTAFQSDALAQTRRGNSGSTPSRSTSTTTSRSTTTRSTSTPSRNTTTTRSSKPAKPNSISTSTSTSSSRPTVHKPSTSVSRPTSGPSTKPTAGTVSRPSARPTAGTVSRPSTKPTTVPSTKPTTPPSVGRPATTVRPQQPSRPGVKPQTVTRPTPPGANKPGGNTPKPTPPVQIKPDYKPDPHWVHPRDRGFMHYNKPSYFWTSHNHYYGHRVRVLPSHVHRHVYHGVTYYCYNDIWYRPYGGYYVVCRPPFGTVLAANLIADMTWAAIRFSYYNTVAQTYSQINENNEYIAQQNAVIAQNNATIAAQNAQIAAGQQQAQAAYSLANELGLVQSYAAAESTYYYQDGVFYTMDTNGQYSVIVPPAGALVETLPEDYDLVTLKDGNQYYKVDDTVYKVTIVEGKPYFEVLGQLYN